MKQKIYEIPIWEAYETKNCECPLCSIEKKSDDNFIQTLFSEMVMDVRLNPHLVENYDFCHEHFEKLYRYPDKCGLAVLTNRILHLKKEALKSSELPRKSVSKNPIKKLFIKNIETIQDKKECLLCNKLDESMNNYMKTLVNLWVKEENFKEIYKNSRGFCLKHYNQVLKISSVIINNQLKQEEFIEITSKIQEENLNRLQQELEWFISKFDYRFANEPWNTSKDALIRTIQKLIGNYNTKI
ncbi:hypothetical protein JK636_06410 [Clostridium sp. YIM B02515]|uniref:ABC transporter substrate-binding protein n=1 Tax=Clostridium rhizosphaerae TaxID=2803861 RepID=A0ABS1T7R2_9CLOT|nr:DUF6062 family protein [Clostridium rhizosphaerae]MBL4935388.1 hypothetical protein [Clostridium rhizosphaerae]